MFCSVFYNIVGPPPVLVNMWASLLERESATLKGGGKGGATGTEDTTQHRVLCPKDAQKLMKEGTAGKRRGKVCLPDVSKAQTSLGAHCS